jgi:hypothetical protein
VRQRDHRNAQTKSTPLIIINHLRPIKSASMPANKVEITLPSSTAATIEGKLSRVQTGSRLQIRQRPGDNPDIHPIEQSAQTGHQQQEAVVTHLGGRRGEVELISAILSSSKFRHSLFLTGPAILLASKGKRTLKIFRVRESKSGWSSSNLISNIKTDLAIPTHRGFDDRTGGLNGG